MVEEGVEEDGEMGRDGGEEVLSFARWYFD